MKLWVLVVSVVVGQCTCSKKQFPKGFKFGAATAAYQIEGGWDADDKGISIWDTFTHEKPERIKMKHNGDVACDSYHKWKTDVQMIKKLGLDYYRFSINWPRLLPNGTANYISEAGKKYYNDIINELKANKIEPYITLYHWDLPQYLQDLGGWASPHIVDWFGDYARIIFKLFGDRVKTWLTINEPIFCDIGYSGIHAPGLYNPHGVFLCNKYVLLAHARAYRIYDREFRKQQKGRVSLPNILFWYEEKDLNSEEDKIMAENARQYMAGRYTHAIYSEKGGWPPEIERIMQENSEKEGYPRSKLPPFTKAEIDEIKGSADFFGFNYYSSFTVRKANPGEHVGACPFFGFPELGAICEWRDEWPKADTFWFRVNPIGMRKSLNWLKDNYGDIEIVITENGFATDGNDLNDVNRTKYYKDHLEQVLLAIHEDKVNVTGYTAWSLMDNFEWSEGYTSKFGIWQVDFDSPDRTRTMRKSAHFYKNVVASRSLDVADHIKNEL